ncbi:methyltransferase [Halomonas sp.]|uniref:methyltransferase n=1 Tax=Halomonas sp. TaxID=1486246 RepID=UPI003A94617C
MSAQTPACQLLERQQDDYTALMVVAPPADAWLIAQSSGVISGDLGVLIEWQAVGKQAYSPFALPENAVTHGKIVLFWPKAHQLGIWWLEWLCSVLPAGTAIEIVGEHSGGVKRVPKVLAEREMVCDKRDNARRCSLFATRTVALENTLQDAWQRFEALGLTLVSHPGVFGHGKVDEGTLLLLECLEKELPKTPQRVLDMGCGDGIISAWLAKRGHAVTAVDVSAFAVEATRRTLEANQVDGHVLQSDVYSALESQTFDFIISNPPFHQERDVSYGPSQRLIRQAPEHLANRGRLVIVANVFLPYPDVLTDAFGSFGALADNRRFRVYGASKSGR